MERKAQISRKTNETDITLKIVLESNEVSVISSGVPFFDHMLASMSRHGRFFLELRCDGDYKIDDHHTVEDVGICMGKAFKKALGDKTGISRFGEAILPMDDVLTLVAVDLSGRGFFRYSGIKLEGYINRYSEELTLEFLRSFAYNLEMNLHVKLFYGINKHHIHESVFKSLGVSLFRAYSIDQALGNGIPSVKGTI